ncbi:MULTISPECIES: hypothetical protein [Pseudomonas]|uniref:Uncharacterized protein n=1 Tax=Pseudomonas fluorescens ICMP 11288 TaxID=1198309 RepID=A0A0W0I1V2_PSEFL|nr:MULTISPECIES: hypothetical protein [Pseudomonas]KTB67015.1 hypothetical protein AO063_21180 [Pseudomonas fluorescens ICMP 11288]
MSDPDVEDISIHDLVGWRLRYAFAKYVANYDVRMGKADPFSPDPFLVIHINSIQSGDGSYESFSIKNEEKLCRFYPEEITNLLKNSDLVVGVNEDCYQCTVDRIGTFEAVSADEAKQKAMVAIAINGTVVSVPQLH